MGVFYVFALLAVLPWLVRSQLALIARLEAQPELVRSHGLATATPVILELLAAALSVGVSVPRALTATGNAIGGSAGLDLAQAGRHLELGAGWRQAWAHTPAQFRIISAALRPGWEDGAAVTEALRAAGEAARRVQQDEARIAAGRLGVRLVLPLGLCLLPAFVLIGIVPMLLALGLGLVGS